MLAGQHIHFLDQEMKMAAQRNRKLFSLSKAETVGRFPTYMYVYTLLSSQPISACIHTYIDTKIVPKPVCLRLPSRFPQFLDTTYSPAYNTYTHANHQLYVGRTIQNKNKIWPERTFWFSLIESAFEHLIWLVPVGTPNS